MTRRAVYADRMSPNYFEERLEDMVRDADRRRGEERYSSICGQIARHPESLWGWLEGVQALHERLLLSDDARIHLVTSFIEERAYEQHDPELRRLLRKADQLDRDFYRAKDERLVRDLGLKLNAANAAADERNELLIIARLRTMGLSDIADLKERDPGEFERRSEKGRAELFDIVPVSELELAELLGDE